MLNIWDILQKCRAGHYRVYNSSLREITTASSLNLDGAQKTGAHSNKLRFQC